MNEPGPGSEGGWNAARLLGMIVGVLGMVGFGFCSLCGLVVGVSGDRSAWGIVLPFAVPGLILAILFFFLARAMYRRAHRKPPDAPGP